MTIRLLKEECEVWGLNLYIGRERFGDVQKYRVKSSLPGNALTTTADHRELQCVRLHIDMALLYTMW